MAVIKNLPDIKKRLDLYTQKLEGVHLNHFRSAVWAVFRKILRSTPQWSGKAVANWNIGIDAPDFTVDEQAGEGGGEKTFQSGSQFTARQVGDNKWVEFAELMNKGKLIRIKSKTRVYISNGVTGDTDKGKSSENYLADLQNPSYWARKLRLVNMPYETVAEVVISESWREFLSDKSGLKLREGLLS